MTITRFAPSPTGRLHLGHAFSALAAHDFARAREGEFRLRIEDLDAGRSRPEFVDGIYEDLAWLGLDHDGLAMVQSKQADAYAAALESLKARGLLYACICTRADIAAATAAPHETGAIYPGTCRGRSAGEGEGEVAWAWRLDMEKALAAAGPLSWFEGDAEVLATPGLLGDVVLARKDAPAAYHLAVAVDDDAQGVTDVVRGEDLRESTHVHRLLQALLGLRVPRWHHHRLLLGDDGKRLAKRNGAKALAELRAAGVKGEDVVAQLRARS